MDNIFRVYSRQFSRGGVALIAVVHRGFASVPTFFAHSRVLTTARFFHPPLDLSFRSLPLLMLVPCPRAHGHSPAGISSFRAARSARQCAPLYSLGSNLRTAGATRTNARCARREGARRIFVFAHSRANAHPSSRGGTFFDERKRERGAYRIVRAKLFHWNTSRSSPP